MAEKLDRGQTSKEKIAQIYPEYIYMIRAFVREGILEPEEPTESQLSWASRAVLRNDETLVKTVAQLAGLAETAYKQRFLEGMPMLIDLDMSKEPDDFSSPDRLHFLRAFIREFEEFDSLEPDDNFFGMHPSLYVETE